VEIKEYEYHSEITTGRIPGTGNKRKSIKVWSEPIALPIEFAGYSMNAAEARELAAALVKAAEMAEGEQEGRRVGHD
jgi:hypothetical protein